MAGLFAMLGCYMAYWLYRHQMKREFMGAVLAMACSVLQEHPLLLVMAGVVLCVQTLWSILFVVSCVQAFHLSHYGTLYVYLFLVLCWTSQVFRQVIHCLTAGTVAHWYFRLATPLPTSSSSFSSSSSHEEPSDAQHAWDVVWHVTKRVLRYHLGSVCFGALVVFPVSILWNLSTVMTRCLPRLCAWIEALHDRFNAYGFTTMLMYGTGFSESSYRTMRAFKEHGIDAIGRSDRVGTLLLWPTLGGSCFLTSLAVIVCRWYDLADNWYLPAIVVFWVTFYTLTSGTELMEACRTAIITCFSEEPRLLLDIHPLIYHRFVRLSEFSSFHHQTYSPT